MGSDLALQLMGEMLWTAVLVSAPMLLGTLLIGLFISIFQVVTQIQEMSLAFVPKLITAVITLVVFGPWMLRRMIQFSTSVISNIPQYF
ncbi:flagellar biosynthesis protein FliQ [Polaromonas sp. A23]|uniref:flagellar biosynthesis protein FliQ n=1 Tax=Polaromonas sp. A23 TaxID=1944133 RepID=UPI000984B798|nr:flagellar biosynthesis protein FliQ [Polaromonas sp. A23]OOG44454.1 flagellar biosynthetic protein FliQ [Polaromonas sp. A23]